MKNNKINNIDHNIDPACSRLVVGALGGGGDVWADIAVGDVNASVAADDNVGFWESCGPTLGTFSSHSRT